MATITYQCSVCDREVDILEKPANLNVFSKCIITNGCRGKLNKISRNQDNIRESFPAPVLGLQDYVQRKVFYPHYQIILNSVWSINHNLGAVPAVDVFVQTDSSTGELTKLDINEYKIFIVDKNNCRIEFSIPYTGTAHLVARTSVQDFDLAPTVADNSFKITYGGIFVFAIPKFLTKFSVPPVNYTQFDLPLDLLNQNIRVRVSVTEPNKEEIICIESINLRTLNSTPWVGWKEILLRKRRNYYIKYKSIFSFTSTFELDTLSAKDIPDGTQVRFLEIDFGTGSFQPIEQGDLLLLLANPPYQSIDKVRNKIIDVGAMIQNDYDYFLYQGGELYTSEVNVQTTYPMIEKVK
jgi:predicted RNA-binding protein